MNDKLHFIRTVDRAELVGAMIQELSTDLPPADKHFLAHVIVAHGVGKDDAVDNGAEFWRGRHELMHNLPNGVVMDHKHR